MPTYEYLCQDCSHRFELKQSIKDDPVATCGKCGKSVGRIISAPAIMFKGSGWYVTDYSEKMKPPTGESSDSTSDTKKEAAGAPSAPASTPADAAKPSSTAASGSGSGTSPSAGSTSSSGGTASSGSSSSQT